MGNPYHAYKRNSVTTASAKSILVQLHEKALIDAQIAHESWQQNDSEKMREHITAIQDILSYLHTNLQPETELGDTLGALYRYYLVELAKLFVEPSEELFTEIKEFLEDWKETWWKAQ